MRLDHPLDTIACTPPVSFGQYIADTCHRGLRTLLHGRKYVFRHGMRIRHRDAAKADVHQRLALFFRVLDEGQ